MKVFDETLESVEFSEQQAYIAEHSHIIFHKLVDLFIGDSDAEWKAYGVLEILAAETGPDVPVSLTSLIEAAFEVADTMVMK